MSSHGDVVQIPEISSLVEQAQESFRSRFGRAARYCGIAPGRVNLIGEHTDYNDGFVLPMALPLVTVMVGDIRVSGDSSRVITLSQAADEPRELEFGPGKLTPGKPAWANYVKGVVANFHLGQIPAFEAVIATSVPLGGGVSSSASLEVACFMFLAALTSHLESIDLKEVARACQKAEHQFADMPCGIMDQMVTCLAKPGTALLLDCRSLETDFVPLDDPELVVLVTNSNVRHTLTGSEYPSRRRSCETSAQHFSLKSLRDLDMDTLLNGAEGLADQELLRRSRHIVSEIKRTQDAAAALKTRDYKQFGRLMNESHFSLRDDFEVSCPEVDELVALAQSVPGVFGSRMTGGGFGGCTVTLVTRDAVDRAIEVMRSGYHGSATFYVCEPAAGSHGFQFPHSN